ncbi:MAG: hypothetical protein U0R70_12460 [Solirubrobacteraceae bacterium]
MNLLPARPTPILARLGATAAVAAVAAALAPVTAAAAPVRIFTVAGDGKAGSGGIGGLPAEARLNSPGGLSSAPDGSLLIADAGNDRVLRISPDGRTLAAILSNGLSRPGAAAAAPDGSILIADTGNNRIVRVSADGGTVATVAGTGVPGAEGDGGPPAAARLNGPSGVAVAPDGSVVIADTGSNRVRRITPDGARIETLAGTGDPSFSGDGGPPAAAAVHAPFGVAAAADGSVLVADTGNARVRRISADRSRIDTIAGTGEFGFAGDGGPPLGAKLQAVLAVSVAPDRSVLIADSGNARIRRIAPDRGRIDTVAGAGGGLFGGDGGPATDAGMDPRGVAAGPDGTVYISGNHRIRAVPAGFAAPPAPVQIPGPRVPVPGPAVHDRPVVLVPRQLTVRRREVRRAWVLFAVSRSGRLVVELRRRGRPVARLGGRVARGARRLRLPRAAATLTPGRYVLRVTVIAADRTRGHGDVSLRLRP